MQRVHRVHQARRTHLQPGTGTHAVTAAPTAEPAPPAAESAGPVPRTASPVTLPAPRTPQPPATARPATALKTPPPKTLAPKTLPPAAPTPAALTPKASPGQLPPPPAGPARSGSSAAAKPPTPAARSGKVGGLALAGCGVAVAWGTHRLLPAVPMLTVAVVLGVVVAHLAGVRTLVRGHCRPGLSYAGKRLMRLGIVLLGLKLSLDDVLGLGWATVGMVFGVVAATFFGTLWLGRRLKLPGDQPLLIATGYSICGASAIGAVSEASESDERDVATSVALVTLCGTLAILVLPLLQAPLGLNDTEFGRWAGASVHDVGQVVATAQSAGSAALGDAVLVKLMRVAMLAPLVAAVALSVRARARAGGRLGEDLAEADRTADAGCTEQPGRTEDASRREEANGTEPSGGAEAGRAGPAGGPAARGGAGAGARRPPLVPLFVAGFLAMVALRSTDWLPGGALDAAGHVQELLLAAALFGLGSAVHLPTLARTGGRVAALGLCSWVVIAGVSYAGVLVTS